MNFPQNTKLFKVIQAFRRDFKVLKDNPKILNSFYDYLSTKYSIRCETGMVIVERFLFCGVFKEYRDASNTPNVLLLSKIRLYSWLELRHLGVDQAISQDSLNEAILLFTQVETGLSVSEMIDKYMMTISKVYESIGVSSDHSLFFSVFILVVVKSQSSCLALGFIEKFRRRPYEKCRPNCTHGFDRNTTCRCLKIKDWDSSEVDYYLTVYKAALEFIEKMEFYDLKITPAEFNQKIGQEK